jgi:hypothetical protein
VTDCIFFVNVNLHPRFKRFNESACGEERAGEASVATVSAVLTVGYSGGGRVTTILL